MDPEVARTLDELERKIAELERTLGSIAHEEQPTGGGSGTLPETSPAPPPVLDENAGARSWSRVVDEAIEAPPAPRPARSPEPPAKPEHAPPLVHSQTPARLYQPASRNAGAEPAPTRAPAPRSAPQAGSAPPPSPTANPGPASTSFPPGTPEQSQLLHARPPLHGRRSCSGSAIGWSRRLEVINNNRRYLF